MQLEELVRRIRHGDKEAVKELVSTYGNSVYQRAYERTRDKELAREAARQTFGQFVAIVQQQPEDDGWSLWFGDLIERNISTYAQISTDMRTIESELDQEIPTQEMPAFAAPVHEEQEPVADPMTEPSFDREVESLRQRSREIDETSIRDEIFDEPYRKKEKKEKTGKPKKDGKSSHGLTIFLLVLVSLMLLWVVAGVAMTMQWIPFYDLGYSWFNQNVFALF